MGHGFDSPQLVMMPPNTNRCPSMPGDRLRLGQHRFAAPTCRDAVVAAFQARGTRTGADTFTVRQVHAEMVAAGCAYTEAVAFKTMQRMKAAPVRPPLARLERFGRAGFRLAEAD